MRRVLITGGFGFVGTNLAEQLLAASPHYEVVILDNLSTGKRHNQLLADPRLNFIEADICSVDFSKLPTFDHIYHLACPASPKAYQSDPLQTLQTCFNGTLQVLAFAKQCGSTVVFSSTSEVYGDPQICPQPEHYTGNVSTQSPRACYDEGKRVAETLCYEYSRQGVNIRIARLFNAYGPYMSADDGRLVPNLINQLLRAEPMTIYGDGLQTRALCYVNDTVSGLIALMNQPLTGLVTVNIGNDHETTILEVATRLARLKQCPARMVYGALPYADPRRRCPDLTQTMRLLGWQPKVPLDQGLRQTLDYFSQQASHCA